MVYHLDFSHMLLWKCLSFRYQQNYYSINLKIIIRKDFIIFIAFNPMLVMFVEFAIKESIVIIVLFII